MIRNGRVGRVSEGLGAELDAVCLDQSFRQREALQLGRQRHDPEEEVVDRADHLYEAVEVDRLAHVRVDQVVVPLSSTENNQSPFWRVAVTSTWGRFSSPNLIAFEMRFWNIWAISTPSAGTLGSGLHGFRA